MLLEPRRVKARKMWKGMEIEALRGSLSTLPRESERLSQCLARKLPHDVFIYRILTHALKQIPY